MLVCADVLKSSRMSSNPSQLTSGSRSCLNKDHLRYQFTNTSTCCSIIRLRYPLTKTSTNCSVKATVSAIKDYYLLLAEGYGNYYRGVILLF
ncbi:hypothetical protein Q1695_006398 [Nippostrongylus brasiliensis]|nr:hypothetical protein Q1695_006398 [Nippostrongylus brasiliensis]